MSSHDGDIFFQRSWWIGRRMVWSTHALQRSSERCVPIFDRLPPHARSFHMSWNEREGYISIWQVVVDDVPFVIVGHADMDTHSQKPEAIVVVVTCWVEDLSLRLVDRRREERSKRRKDLHHARHMHREFQSPRNERLKLARMETTSHQIADRFEP